VTEAITEDCESYSFEGFGVGFFLLVFFFCYCDFSVLRASVLELLFSSKPEGFDHSGTRMPTATAPRGEEKPKGQRGRASCRLWLLWLICCQMSARDHCLKPGRT